MSYTIDQIKKGAASFLDTSLIPILPAKSWQRILYGAAIAMYINKIDQIIPAFGEMPLIKGLGIFKEDGTIDLDSAMPYIKKQMESGSFDIDLPGMGSITFKGEDLDKLYDFIKTAK